MSWLVTNLSVFLSLPDAKPFSFQALAHIKLSSRPDFLGIACLEDHPV